MPLFPYYCMYMIREIAKLSYNKIHLFPKYLYYTDVYMVSYKSL